MRSIFRYGAFEMPLERVEVLVVCSFGRQQWRWFKAIPVLCPKQRDYRNPKAKIHQLNPNKAKPSKRRETHLLDPLICT